MQELQCPVPDKEHAEQASVVGEREEEEDREGEGEEGERELRNGCLATPVHSRSCDPPLNSTPITTCAPGSSSATSPSIKMLVPSPPAFKPASFASLNSCRTTRGRKEGGGCGSDEQVGEEEDGEEGGKKLVIDVALLSAGSRAESRSVCASAASAKSTQRIDGPMSVCAPACVNLCPTALWGAPGVDTMGCEARERYLGSSTELEEWGGGVGGKDWEGVEKGVGVCASGDRAVKRPASFGRARAANSQGPSPRLKRLRRLGDVEVE